MSPFYRFAVSSGTNLGSSTLEENFASLFRRVFTLCSAIFCNEVLAEGISVTIVEELESILQKEVEVHIPPEEGNEEVLPGV